MLKSKLFERSRNLEKTYFISIGSDYLCAKTQTHKRLLTFYEFIKNKEKMFIFANLAVREK